MTEEEYQVHLNRINVLYYVLLVLAIFALSFKLFTLLKGYLGYLQNLSQFADLFLIFSSLVLIKKKFRTGFVIYILIQLITMFFLVSVFSFIIKAIIVFFVIKGFISAQKVHEYEVQIGLKEKKTFKQNFIFFSVLILFLTFGTVFFGYLEEYPKDQVQKGIELKYEQKKTLLDLKILEKEEFINYYYELNSEDEHYLHFYTNEIFYYYNLLASESEDKFISLDLKKIETLEFKESDSFLLNNSTIHIKGIDGTEFNLHLSNHFGKDKDYYENLLGFIDKAKSKKP